MIKVTPTTFLSDVNIDENISSVVITLIFKIL